MGHAVPRRALTRHSFRGNLSAAVAGVGAIVAAVGVCLPVDYPPCCETGASTASLGGLHRGWWPLVLLGICLVAAFGGIVSGIVATRLRFLLPLVPALAGLVSGIVSWKAPVQVDTGALVSPVGGVGRPLVVVAFAFLAAAGVALGALDQQFRRRGEQEPGGSAVPA